jgi:hypothetical protein
MTPDLLILATMPAMASGPMLADLDKFWIFVAIAIGSIIVEWLKKRKQPGETDTSTDTSDLRHPATPTSSRQPAPPPGATSDWEEELRRLLGGEPPVARPPPIPTPQPSPPPIRPVVIQTPRPALVPTSVSGAPPIVKSIPPTLAGTAMAEAEKRVEVQLPSLKESVTVYQRASHLQEQVIERLKHVEEMTERHAASAPTAHRPTVSADAVQTIALIRNRHMVRQAVIASLILGTPKSLENE